MKRPTFLITIIYAFAVIMLGIMGFRAGSVTSLVTSLTIGSLILLMLFLSIILKKNWPIFFALIAVVALLSFFIFRFKTTENFMSAVMTMFSSLVAILMTIWLASKKKI